MANRSGKKHYLKGDTRYSWQLAWAGYSEPKYCVMFCDIEWISCVDTIEEAKKDCLKHKEKWNAKFLRS